jgi:hypothetical protein
VNKWRGLKVARPIGQWEVIGRITAMAPLVKVPIGADVQVYINGVAQSRGVDYFVAFDGKVWWHPEARLPHPDNSVLIRAWEGEPPSPPVLRVVRPTILCSQCGEPMTPGDPRRRRRAKAQPARGYRCRPCGREVRP